MFKWIVALSVGAILGMLEPSGTAGEFAQAWLIPALLAAGGLLQGGGALWGANQQNKANRRTAAEQRRRNTAMEADIRPRLGQGPGSAEKALLQFLTGGTMGEQWNTGQDALMQTLRGGSYDPIDLFASWEPLEGRALEESLAGAFSGASGLGQRFGSAMMREEGRVRGEAAENAAARRQQATMDLYNTGEDRKLNASQILLNSLLTQRGQTIGGLQGAAGLANQRGQNDLSLLSLLYGQPMGVNAPSAMPGALGDIGQLMAMLPLLFTMMGQQNQQPVT